MGARWRTPPGPANIAAANAVATRNILFDFSRHSEPFWRGGPSFSGNQLMSMTPPDAGASPPAPSGPPTTGQKLARWASIAVGIVIGILGLVRLYGAFTLPSCDSSRMTDTLHSIYKKQNVEIKSISDIKTVNSSSSEITCTAVMQVGDDRIPINYRTFWEGWSAQVSAQAGLPTCDSRTADETLRNIFKGRNVTINNISDAKTVTTSEAENVCTAQVDAPGELANITYRIFRKDGQTQVLITDVKSQPKGGAIRPPSKTSP
jgi:hypothetical protein